MLTGNQQYKNTNQLTDIRTLVNIIRGGSLVFNTNRDLVTTVHLSHPSMTLVYLSSPQSTLVIQCVQCSVLVAYAD